VTKFGQAIYPVPSADPNDPLRLPQWRKEAILICVVLYSLIGNATGLAPSVYILPWATEFGVSPNISSKIVSYGILAYGVANLVWVPFALKFGRRTAWLSSLLLYVVFMAAASQAKTYEQLLVFHILGCFGAGICESVAVMVHRHFAMS
jgi:MFS family permease